MTSQESSEFVSSETTFTTNSMDTFFNMYSDVIIDLYYELSERFNSFNPFFLMKMTSANLTSFVMDTRFDQLSNQPCNTELYYKFLEWCPDELQLSYRLLCSYLGDKSVVVPFESWQQYCYEHSDLCEIKPY